MATEIEEPMTNLNRTIHANEQLRATMEEWVAGVTLEKLRFHAYMAASIFVSTPAGPTNMYAGLAAMKLLELVEQKEREEAA